MKRVWFAFVLALGTIATTVMIPSAPVLAAASGHCAVSNPACSTLTVTIPAPGVPQGTKITATRVLPLGTFDPSQAIDDKFDLTRVNATTYTSGGVIWGTSSVNTCGTRPDSPRGTGFTSDTGKFIVTATGGSVSGATGTIDLCGQITKRAGLNLSGGNMGGLTWAAYYGSKLCSNSKSSASIKGPTTITVPFDSTGAYNKGVPASLVLKPGTYTVHIVCNVSADEMHEYDVKSVTGSTAPIVVKAGEILDLGDLGTTLGAATTAADTQAVCTVDSLTWLVCPVISVAQAAVGSLSSVVKDQLKFAPLSSGNTGLKPAWGIFRDLSNVFFVLIFFVVIFGTSLGLDNYTVKKILPRLIAAAVLVQFSYLLVGFMVDISNVLGVGIDSLLAAAIPSGAKAGNEGVMQIAGTIELIGVGVGAGVGALTFAPFLAEFAIPLILALCSAIIGLVAVFVTLQIRIMLIDFLIIVAPIAFLLWVLPNTDKYFKIWRETLVKLLLMYPIIVLLLATAKLFSVIITSAGNTSNWTKLGAALGPIIALFLIPATFKLAGGALMAGSNFVKKGSTRGQKGIAGMRDKSNQNRAYNRQQKGLGKINALNEAGPASGFFGKAKQGTQRRYAQHQAGLGIDTIDPNRMAGALEKNDRDQLTSATRKLENDSPDELKKKALDSGSDQFTRRAAIAKLAAIEKTDHLADILESQYGNDNTSSEWVKATAGNYAGLKEKAPHLVTGKANPELGHTNEAFDSLTADRGVKLDAVGAQAMVNRREALSAAHANANGAEKTVAKAKLDAFDENVRNVMVGINRSTAGVNNIKNPTRDKLNELSQHSSIGMKILTPTEKAALPTGPQPQPGPQPTPQPQPTPHPQPGPAPAPPYSPSTIVPNVSPSVSASQATIQQAAAIATQQKQNVQSTLQAYHEKTGTPLARVEEAYFSDKPEEITGSHPDFAPNFKQQVDTARSRNMSVHELLNQPPPPPPPHLQDPIATPENPEPGDDRSIT